MSLIQRHNLIIVGCGPNYQKNYHSVLKEQGVKIALLIDLEVREKEIIQFLENQELKPERTLFLCERFRNLITPDEIDVLICCTMDLSEVDGVLISTEPKIRKSYALWALKRKLAVFMDKPVTAFADINKADNLLEDYEQIARAAKENQTDVVVSCERRAHVGYLWIKEYLKELMQSIKIPITAIDIHFAGGVFRFPEEYITTENHPFKHGYGILLHSGYHYIDLLTTFLSLNDALFRPKDVSYALKWISCRPKEQINSMGKVFYSSLLGAEETEKVFSRDFQAQLENCGEVDLMLIGQAYKQPDRLTNFSLRLFGTSVSQREKTSRWAEHLKGRMRQEHLILHLGHLCSIQIASNPLKKLDPDTYATENFSITIMHSPLIQGRKPVFSLNREKISEIFPYLPPTESMNGYARKWQLEEFLQGRHGNSSLESHRETVTLLHQLYCDC